MKKFNYIVAALALLSGAMFCSCVEDKTDLPLHNQHQIDFTASSDTEWQDVTRAAEEEPQVMILEMEGDEDLEQPLYLHITCEDREDPTAEELFGEETTRGNVTTTENFVDKFGTKGFGLFAYVYKPGEWSTAKSDYIHNLPVPYRENTGKWHIHEYETGDVTSTGYYFWPGKNYNVQFYAYAPHRKGYESHILGVPSNYYDNNNGDEPDGPYIDFLLSNNNVNQFDLCVARSGELPGNYNQTLHLNFKHALSAIDFIADATMPKGTISSIYFFNTMRQDRYFFEEERWAGEEQYTTTSQIGFNKNYSVALDGGKEQNITDSSTNSTFFMIPHTLKDDAYMRVDYTDPNGTVHNLSVSLKGVKWEMGKRYIYRLSPKLMSSNYVLEVTAPSKTKADYLGFVEGSTTSSWTEGNVVSYRIDTYRFGRQEKVPVKWITEFSTDNGASWTTTRPAMFPNFTAGGNGCLDTAAKPDRYGANFTPVVPNDPLNPFGNDIASRPENENIVNLYSKDKKYNSANCYVVNAAGTYRFPLVYGNAIKGAKANPDAYAGDIFVDHTGTKINSPYIPDNYLTNAVAVLLWSDAPQLITNVTLSTSTMTTAGNPTRYIQFTAPKESLTPGNAVIALYDKDPSKGGTIVWSWHIWVTQWTGQGVTLTSQNKSYTFANEILGYSPSRNAEWKSRSVKVRFKQTETESNKSFTYTFSQDGHTIKQFSEGNMPYYQWGRKDPLLPYHYLTDESNISIDGEEKLCYSSVLTQKTFNIKSGASKTYTYSGYFGIEHIKGEDKTEGGVGKTIAESIKNPHVFYSRHKTYTYGSDGTEYDWCSDAMADKVMRWNSAASGYASNYTSAIKTVKTIYDPCPPGWCVPPVGAWHVLTVAGGATGKGSYKKVNASSSNEAHKHDDTRAFCISGLTTPITGDRNRYNGLPWEDTKNARPVEVWCSTPKEGEGGDGKNYLGCACFVKSSNTVYIPSEIGMSSGIAILPVEEH